MIRVTSHKVFALLMALGLVTSGLALASHEVALPFNYNSFKTAKSSDSFIHFKMVHRKLGFMASSFDGVVKAFTVKGDFENKTFEHPVVSFHVTDMDTDNKSRNSKMTVDTLKSKDHPDVQVMFNKTLSLGTQTVPGTIDIMGSKKPIVLPITIQDMGTTYRASGKTSVLMSALGIPKPKFVSDAIVSVDDKVAIDYQLTVPKDKL